MVRRQAKYVLMKEKITIATKKDFDVSYYCGPGPGGQKKNKSATGVQIIHSESGAIGRAHDSRSQADNKVNAFKDECPRRILMGQRRRRKADPYGGLAPSV